MRSIQEWTATFTDALAAAMSDLAKVVKREPIELLMIDCQPWHGALALSALTASEVRENPALRDPEEAAVWRYFEVSDKLKSWRATKPLATQMHKEYHATDDSKYQDRKDLVERYLAACRKAASSKTMRDALTHLVRGKKFRISITHPDDGLER